MADRQQVIAQLYPKLQAALAGTGIDPRIAMAQFLQETGGNLDAPGYGIFNITKGNWTGPTIRRGDTNAAGQKIQQEFRAYGSIDEAVADYAKMISTSPRYAKLRGGTLEEQAAALGASGYAEDPNYGSAVLKIAKGLPAGTGAAYPTRPVEANANGIPGGVRPSDLEWGGGAPQGVVSPTGTAPAPTAQARSSKELEQLLVARFPYLRVTSRDRDPEHNRKVGGAKGSQHLHGTAIDIGMKELTPAQREEVARYAQSIGARGFGYYPKSDSMHFDVRQGPAAYWGGNYSRTSLPQTPEWFQNFSKTGSTGAAYPSTPVTPNANNIPGGVRPEDLPWGGGIGPSQPPGVISPGGATNAPAVAPVTEVAPTSVTPANPTIQPNSDAARALSDPGRYGVDPAVAAQLRAYVTPGGTLGNIQPSATPVAPPGIVAPQGAPPPAPITPPPFDPNKRMGLLEGIFAGAW